MPITCRIVATPLLALALAGGASTAELEASPTGVFATTLVRVEIPRVVRTGLGDMTTGAPQRSAISTPARTPGCASRRPFDWPRP